MNSLKNELNFLHRLVVIRMGSSRFFELGLVRKEVLKQKGSVSVVNAIFLALLVRFHFTDLNRDYYSACW